MSKKRNSNQVQLPEIVVTPQGNYTHFTGEETILPSLDTFRKAEIQKERIKAIGKMLNLETPIDPMNPDRSYLSRFLGITGTSDEERRKLFGLDKDRNTCLSTVSSMYNDKMAAGNVSFSKAPESYGFTEIDPEYTIPGDVIQFWKNGVTPIHASMVTNLNPEGSPLISYSNGNIPTAVIEYGPNGQSRIADSMVKNRDILDKEIQDLGTQHTYRYIGTPEKHKQIERRYEMLKKGQRVYQGGGFLEPKGAWDKLSMREKAAMIKVGVQNGLLNLQDIRQKYNEFAEGGDISDEEYYSTMEKVAEDNYQKWGLSSPEEALVHALNDNTYN